MTTTLPGFTVTTTVRVIEPAEPPAFVDDILIPGDWRFICDRDDDAPEWGVADCGAC